MKNRAVYVICILLLRSTESLSQLLSTINMITSVSNGLPDFILEVMRGLIPVKIEEDAVLSTVSWPGCVTLPVITVCESQNYILNVLLFFIYLLIVLDLYLNLPLKIVGLIYSKLSVMDYNNEKLFFKWLFITRVFFNYFYIINYLFLYLFSFKFNKSFF